MTLTQNQATDQQGYAVGLWLNFSFLFLAFYGCNRSPQDGQNFPTPSVDAPHFGQKRGLSAGG